MNKEIRILIILLCAVALTFGSCAKHSLAPEEDQQEVIEFTTKSQASWVKSDEPAFPYQNFGVWGIARNDNVEFPYTLWYDTQLIEVSGKQPNSNAFVPEKPAYWLKDYTYNFIAIAPHNDGGLTITNIVTKKEQKEATQTEENIVDHITFTYDLEGRYTGTEASEGTPAIAPNFTFDLLGAATQRTVSTAGYSTSETLTFWHLFSQINIKVLFKDPNGATLEGEVTGMRLDNVDTDASYTLYYDESNDKNLHIGHNAGECKSGTISINETPGADGYSMNIVPQNIANVRLYLDFKVGDAEYENFEAKLNFSEHDTKYLPNNKYNWTLTISNTLYIKFNASVEDWDDGGPADGNIEF